MVQVQDREAITIGPTPSLSTAAANKDLKEMNISMGPTIQARPKYTTQAAGTQDGSSFYHSFHHPHLTDQASQAESFEQHY